MTAAAAGRLVVIFIFRWAVAFLCTFLCIRATDAYGTCFFRLIDIKTSKTYQENKHYHKYDVN